MPPADDCPTEPVPPPPDPDDSAASASAGFLLRNAGAAVPERVVFRATAREVARAHEDERPEEHDAPHSTSGGGRTPRKLKHATSRMREIGLRCQVAGLRGNNTSSISTSYKPPPERAKGDEASASSSRHAVRRPTFAEIALVFAALIAAALIATVAVEECLSVAARSNPTADVAVLEDGVLHAGQRLVGPYSQYGFSHPGPLLFRLLWPAYAASGKSTTSLHLSALLLNTACLCWMIVACLRAVEESASSSARGRCERDPRRLFSGFISRAIPSAFPSAFADIWNPVITILPFAALTVACALLIAGRFAACVPAVLLHAFVCQAHLGYVPVATGFLALSSFWLPKKTMSRQDRGWVAAALFLGVLAWMPTLWDAVTGSRNVSRIVHFFLSDRPRPELVASLGHAVRQLEAPLAYAVGALDPDAPTNGTWLAAALLAAEVALLVRCWRRARVAELPLARVALLGLLGFGLAFLSARHLEPALPLYPTVWFGIVGLFGWVAILGGEVVARDFHRATWRESAVLVGLAPFAIGGVLTVCREVFRTRTDYAIFRADTNTDTRVSHPLAVIAERMIRERSEPVVLTVLNHDDWGFLSGVVLELSKRSVPLRLDPEWQFMFGNGHEYARPTERSLVISSSPVPDRLEVADVSGVGLYTGAAPPVPARVAPSDLWVADSKGVSSDPDAVVADPPPAEGTAWDSPRVVQLRDTESFILLRCEWRSRRRDRRSGGRQ